MFTLTKTVYCLFPSDTAYLWNTRVIPFSTLPQGTIPPTRAGTLIVMIIMLLTILYPPIQRKYVSIPFTFYPVPEISPPCFLTPPYHQWISCNPFTSSPLILMYKVSGKTAILWSISQSIEILLPGNCGQFGSNKLIKILYRFECFSSFKYILLIMLL